MPRAEVSGVKRGDTRLFLARNWRPKRIAGLAFLHLTLAAVCILFVVPFAWMVSSALKSLPEVFADPVQWFPRHPQWKNFPDAWNAAPFTVYFKNTAVIVGLCLIGDVITCSLAGYAFAQLRFRGRDALFVLVLSTLMIPSQVTIIPRFMLFQRLGWVDTLKPLIVPAYFGAGLGGAFYIFLLRQFFRTIPVELDDAAKIDGCNPLITYWRIFAPLSKPALIAVAVFSFVAHWDDFFGPLIYLNSTSKKTISLGLAVFKGEYDIKWHLLMAASTISSIPCIVVFLFSQRYFVKGIVTSGLKG